MAFNPFNAFRKHQKVWFALLTIVCMFVFILQFGSGDLFSRFGIGRGGQGTGEKVTTLYGKDVNTGDLERVRQSRQIANDLVATALDAAAEGANKDLLAYKPDKPDEIDDKLTSLRGSWSSRVQLLQFLSMEQIAQSIRRDLAQVNELIVGLASPDMPDRSKADAQAKAARDLRLLLKIQYMTFNRNRDPFYFGGGVKPDELLDFMIWKHQADQLGVTLTKADARRAVADEAAGRDLPPDPGASWGADPVFKDYFPKHTGFTEEQVVSAVEDEFRVQIAQRLLAGHGSGIPALDDNEPLPTNPVSPYDFWKYYRDNRTTIKAAFLPIAAEALVSDVTDIPSQQELRDLFEQYKSQVPDPTKPTPGFKEPRRIQVEYITASPETPYYKQKTVENALEPQRFYVGAVLGGHLAGGGVAPAAGLAGLLINDPLLTDYQNDETQKNRAAYNAAAVLVGSGAGPFPGLAAPALSLAGADEAQKETRLKQASAAFLTAAAGAPLPGVGLAAAAAPPPQSREQALRQLWEKRQKDAGPRVVQRDIFDFCQELEKVKGNADKAREEIAKAAQERGWVLHSGAGMDDEYAIDKDTALKPLRDALVPMLMDFRRPQQSGSLATVFFRNDPRIGAKTGLYEPDGPFRGEDDTALAFWKVQDEHARELTYEQAQPRVLAAWKLQEARKKALALAQRITAEARGQASPAEAIKFLHDQRYADGRPIGEVFELAGVARLIPGPTPDPGHSAVYMRYVVPAEKIPDAPPGLVDRLLGMQKPGETILFKDLPQTHFYVAVLDERADLEFADRNKDIGFLDAYRDAAQPEKDHLYRQFFVADREKKLQDELMRRLRAEAGPTDDQGRLVLSSAKAQQQSESAPAAPEDQGPPPDFGF